VPINLIPSEPPTGVPSLSPTAIASHGSFNGSSSSISSSSGTGDTSSTAIIAAVIVVVVVVIGVVSFGVYYFYKSKPNVIEKPVAAVDPEGVVLREEELMLWPQELFGDSNPK
jgi:hypothetical protein